MPECEISHSGIQLVQKSHRAIYFLLQMIEQVTMKELSDGEFQTITKLLNGHHAGVLTFLVEHPVNSRGRNARNSRQRIDRNIALRTQLQNPLGYRFFCVHDGIPPGDLSQICVFCDIIAIYPTTGGDKMEVCTFFGHRDCLVRGTSTMTISTPCSRKASNQSIPAMPSAGGINGCWNESTMW